MKVEQFRYLSPEAKGLRIRDGIPPWGVHPCEVDSLDPAPNQGVLYAAWCKAREIRDQLERELVD